MKKISLALLLCSSLLGVEAGNAAELESGNVAAAAGETKDVTAEKATPATAGYITLRVLAATATGYTTPADQALSPAVDVPWDITYDNLRASLFQKGYMGTKDVLAFDAAGKEPLSRTTWGSKVSGWKRAAADKAKKAEPLQIYIIRTE